MAITTLNIVPKSVVYTQDSVEKSRAPLFPLALASGLVSSGGWPVLWSSLAFSCCAPSELGPYCASLKNVFYNPYIVLSSSLSALAEVQELLHLVRPKTEVRPRELLRSSDSCPRGAPFGERPGYECINGAPFPGALYIMEHHLMAHLI